MFKFIGKPFGFILYLLWLFGNFNQHAAAIPSDTTQFLKYFNQAQKIYAQDLEKAWELLDKAQKTIDSTEYPFYLANAYKFKSVIKILQRKSGEALVLQNKAAQLFIKAGSIKGYLETLINCGGIHLANYSFKNAIRYLSLASDIAVLHSFEDKKPDIYLALGQIYYNIENYDSALYYAKKANNARLALDSQAFNVKDLLLLIRTNVELNYSSEAQKYIDYLLKYKDKLAPDQLANLYVPMSNLKLKQGRFKEALAYLDMSSEKLKNSIIKLNHSKIALEYAIVYDSLKDEPNAKRYYKLYSRQLENEKQDLLLTIDNQDLIQNAEFQLALTNKDAELSRAETKRANQKLFWVRLLLIIVAVSCVLLVIFLSNQYRLKKSLTAANVLLTEKMYKIEKMNTELIQLNNLKNKFFSVLSHDLREPISALITTVSMLQNDFKDENKRQVIVSKMSDGLLYAQELLNNTLLWSKSQLNKEKTELLPIAVATTLKDTLFYYEANANQKGIQLQHNLAEANIMSEPTLLQGIVRNVLSNAVKFTNEGGAIAVNSTTSGNTYELEIVDNGIGVDEQLLAEWRSGYFFKSTKGTNKEPGSGLGLAIVFDLMKQSNANIEISSQPNKGTRVKLIFTLV